MKATNQPYDIESSDDRIREILNASDGSFASASTIPVPERLTYANGFYVDCTALFIDIRGSSQLAQDHESSTLGKIYRAYISECIAVVNQDLNCREIFIQGDCVGAVFHTPSSEDVSSVFFRAGQLTSMIQILNWRLSQRGYVNIKCGIGLSTGGAIMMKAGYKGSAINDVIWMGKVVNEAAKLCHLGNRDGSGITQVSQGVYQALHDEWRQLLQPVGFFTSHYQGSFVSVEMQRWIDQQHARTDTLVDLLRATGLLGPPPTSGLRSIRNWHWL